MRLGTPTVRMHENDHYYSTATYHHNCLLRMRFLHYAETTTFTLVKRLCGRELFVHAACYLKVERATIYAWGALS